MKRFDLKYPDQEPLTVLLWTFEDRSLARVIGVVEEPTIVIDLDEPLEVTKERIEAFLFAYYKRKNPTWTELVPRPEATSP